MKVMLVVLILLLTGCSTHFRMRCTGKGKLTGGGGPYAGMLEWDCGHGSSFVLDKSIMQPDPY